MQNQGENCETCRPDGLKLSTVNGVTRVEVPENFGFEDQGGIGPMLERAMAYAAQIEGAQTSPGAPSAKPFTPARIPLEFSKAVSPNNMSRDSHPHSSRRMPSDGTRQFATGQSAAADVLGLGTPLAANNFNLLGCGGLLTVTPTGPQATAAHDGSGITFGPDSLKPPDHQGNGIDVEEILRMNEEERKRRVAEEAAQIAAEEYARRERAWKERHRVELQQVEQRKANCELKCANEKRARDDEAEKDYENGYAALIAATAGAAGAGAGVGTAIPGVGTVAGALGGAAFVAISGAVALMNAHARALASSLIEYKKCMDACKAAYENEMTELRRDL